MGGHGSSSGFSKAQKEVNELYAKLENGDIKLAEYTKGKLNIADKYGISIADINGMSQSGLDVKPKQGSAQTANEDNASKNLAGNGSNPWPPDGSDNHMSWSSSKDIWDQMGGGYNNGGVGGQQAKDMFKAVQDFTDGYYGSIRQAQASGDTTSSAGKKAQQLESFISHGVKAGHEWSGGTTYRGIHLSSKIFDQIRDTPIGQAVDPNIGGVASWSTKRTKSESFAGGGHSGHSVVFVTTGSTHKNAVSIKNLSYYSSENEVLASGNNSYTKVGQFEKNGYLYVYVDVN